MDTTSGSMVPGYLLDLVVRPSKRQEREWSVTSKVMAETTDALKVATSHDSRLPIYGESPVLAPLSP